MKLNWTSMVSVVGLVVLGVAIVTEKLPLAVLPTILLLVAFIVMVAGFRDRYYRSWITVVAPTISLVGSLIISLILVKGLETIGGVTISLSGFLLCWLVVFSAGTPMMVACGDDLDNFVADVEIFFEKRRQKY